MKILFVSFAFPPYNSIGAVRTGKTAKFLRKFGHDIRVISAKDQLYQPTLPVEIPSECVTYANWLSLKGPLDRVKQDNASSGILRGIANNLKKALKATIYPLYKNIFFFPDEYIGWYPYAIKAADEMMKSWRPDLILASAKPVTSLLVAHHLHKKYGLPWFAELRDLWTDTHYYRYTAWRKTWEKRLEKRVFGTAQGLITVSQPLADKLACHGKPVALVLNGYSPEDYPAVRPDIKGRLIRLVYTGRIRPEKQDPAPLFRSLLQLGDLKGSFRVIFHVLETRPIKTLARHYSLEHLIEVNPYVPYKRSLEIQSQADILLLLLWLDPQETGIYFGKIFEYIGTGRPILAIGPANNVAARLIKARKAGAVLSDPAEIAEQLKIWLKQKQTDGQIPGLPAEARRGLSRKEQTARLEDFLKRTLAQPGGDPGQRS